MLDRETILPLLIGALLSIAAHFVLLPAMAQSLRDQPEPAAKLPDLRIESLTLAGKPVAGREAVISWTLSNRGPAGTFVDRPFVTRLVLSNDDAPSDDDLELASALTSPINLMLPAGEPAMPGEYRVKLPAASHGNRFIIAIADASGEIDEGPGEHNNAFAQAVRIFSPDELIKPDLALLAATSPQSAKPGQTIAVEFAIGGATDSEPVTASWFDGVFLSADDKLSDDDLILTVTPGPSQLLRAGEAYTQRADLTLNPPATGPLASADRAFLIFAADHLNRVAELDESNNTLARPIRILRPDAAPTAEEKQGPPDLHIPVFSAPPSAMNGETLTIDYITANRGEGPTKTAQWRDRVYLSTDDKLDESDKLLATYERTQAAGLQPGAYYTARLKGALDLPEKEAGDRFLIIKTDADEAVAESDEKNNIAVRPIAINQLAIGKDKPDEDKVTVAWIPYDDFRKLIAIASETEQPALQNKVDPVPGAPTPRDPSPPSPPATPTQPALTKKNDDPTDPLTAAKQPDPSEDPADPARRIASQSPVVTPAPKPIDQPESKAVAAAPVKPRPQPEATGPAQPGVPVKQPEATTPKPQPGTPATQTEIALPKPIAPVIDPSAPITKPGGTDTDSREPAKSDVTVPKPNPTAQPRTDTPAPLPGDPTRLARADAPPSPDGQPTKLIPSKTDEPAKDGQPTTAPPQKGADTPQPKPAPSATDASKAAPKANDEKTVKPQPPATPSNPTSAPRDESDVPPTILEDKPYNVEPGGVITRPGIQIVASTPDITTPSWLVSGPSAVNPIARITFDRTGKVIAVDMIRSTGHANLDSPIKASFFSFRAKGEALKKVRESFSIEIRLLLKNERD